MYPVLKIMHMLNFLDTFSMGVAHFLVDSQFFSVVNIDTFFTTSQKFIFDNILCYR